MPDFNTNDFGILLQEFAMIPILEERVPTIMEIAGFPHYENVCSNILSYYFDTSNPHGLKDLLLRSLLECTGKDISLDFQETIGVRREEPTSSSKRIDIVVETEDLVVIIENKIYASLYNDLDDYSAHIRTIYAKKINQLKIVLSLEKSFNSNHPSGFINVTYSQFIQCVKSNLGEYMLSGDTKASIFLLDFLQTIQNLIKPETMNVKILDFFVKNQNTIDGLIKERRELQNCLANKVNQLKGLIPPQESNVKQWVYQRQDLVHDFDFNGVVIAVDCIFDFDGIEIRVWIRKGGNSYEYLKKIGAYIGTVFSDEDIIKNRLVVMQKQNLSVLTPIEQVAEKLSNILERISIAGNTLGV